MSEIQKSSTSRREFLKNTGRVAAATAIAGMAVPHVHAAEDNTIRVALIGCGGRGSGAAGDCLSVEKGPVKLVAMADVFEHRIKSSYEYLQESFADKLDVPDERKFVGFDAHKKAMDCLKPGDIAIFATPPAFRTVHCAYAFEKGLHVFMEKPVTTDGPTSRRLLELGKKASEKNLKVAVGLMARHARHLQEVHKRIQDGEVGDLLLMRGYRMHGPVASFSSPKWPGTPSELLWQIQRFHSFLWASGGAFSDYYIHIIDICCWMKNAWPVKAQALGGRHYHLTPEGEPAVDQNFDTYSVEYTFEDGAKFIMDGRTIDGCDQIYNCCAQGTKGIAILSKVGDCAAPSSTYKGQNPVRNKMIWQSKNIPGQEDPYRNEWNDLVDAIRADKPYNELERGVYASLVTSLGRRAAHTGVEITLDEMLNSQQEFAPGIENFTMDSPAPVKADADGKYPVPEPGIKKDREY
jgi:predicted dehydrogenase